MRKHAHKHGFLDRLTPPVQFYVFSVFPDDDEENPPLLPQELEDFLLTHTDVSRAHLINLQPNGELRQLMGIDGKRRPKNHQAIYIHFGFLADRLDDLSRDRTEEGDKILSNLHPGNGHLLDRDNVDALSYIGMGRTGLYYMPPMQIGWTANDECVFDITGPDSPLLRNPYNPDLPSMAEARNRYGIPFENYQSTFYNANRPSLEELENAAAVTAENTVGKLTQTLVDTLKNQYL